MNNQELLNQLWEKYLSDQKMTEGELAQLRALVQNTQYQPQLEQLLHTLYSEKQQDYPAADTSAREAFTEVWARLQTTTPQATPAPVAGMPPRRWWRYAAAAILALSAAATVYYGLQRDKAPTPLARHGADSSQPIQPGSNKALLTLADGSVIALNDAQNGTLARQGNTQVVKLANGQLAYQNKQGAGTAGLYNTIHTPRGGKYHITLPDGSQVWLNAASSLYYPTTFAGAAREVTLTGEAYFEIAPNSAMPFRVKVGDMQVNVLGTQFNINAYEEEAAIHTTLLQGSVQVKAGAAQQLLKPAQRASLQRSNGSLQVQNNVDTEEAIAWKNGLVQFAGTDIHAAMRMIARWYDVEVEYKGDIPNAHFRGALSSNAAVTEVLHMMQQTGEVHFEISGRKIIVLP
ncbi:FecR family protein [Filimonas lacunae]|uniref:FecR family protein n=1 Tax=Filimonas lacunae TaxID=477680 RepID=A0A173MHD2_9BACT|nr:FecR family protein [Filimonas lacunae]BAV06899.1 anti-sigma factor [Filimonas lacunae]SIS98120.1 FecR family protein [Filimonas lacunae]